MLLNFRVESSRSNCGDTNIGSCRLAGRETRVEEQLQGQNNCQLLDPVYHVPLHVRACGESPVSLRSTHMRWWHGKGVAFNVSGLRAWLHRESAQTRTRTYVNVRP